MSKRGCDYGLAFRCSLRDSLQIILFGNSDHQEPNLGAVYHREGLAVEALLPNGHPEHANSEALLHARSHRCSRNTRTRFR